MKHDTFDGRGPDPRGRRPRVAGRFPSHFFQGDLNPPRDAPAPTRDLTRVSRSTRHLTPLRTHLTRLPFPISSPQRDLCAERVVRFLVHFTASRTPGTEEEADEFCENFLGFLLNLATAKDRAIRFRVCQLVAGVLNALGVEAEISDDLYERMEDVMLDRLRDKVPVVRAQAARALSRLQDGGEDGNFSDDVITTSFITLLGAEKNKDVRKAILGSLAISDFTIPHVVERTRDASEDVRRVAFLALTSKVPVASISIALRAAAVRRGLAERSDAVRGAAIGMLKRWHDAFEGDVLALIAALDAESNEDVAASAVRALIECGRVKLGDVAQSVPDGNAANGGLRRANDAELMAPEAAVYWRVVCEELQAAASESGAQAASAVGQRQVVSAAVAGEKLEALEGVLPVNAIDLLDLISKHAREGAKFVARQLLPLLDLMDMADAAARKGTAALCDAQLRAPPQAADECHLDVCGAVSSYAKGGDGRWERSLVTVMKSCHNSPSDAAAAVFACADALIEDVGTPDAHAQALFLASLVLEECPRHVVDADVVEALMATLVRPGVTSTSAAVRRESVRCLGLVGIVFGVRADDGECVRVLRAALCGDCPAVRAVAARALGDLALLYGVQALDEHNPSAEGCEPAQAALAAPLETALLEAVDEEYGDDVEKNSQDEVDESDMLTGGAAAADAERDASVATAAGEALAKLILRRGVRAVADPAAVVARLVRCYFNVDARRRPRMAQCLAVFFPAIASAPADRRALVAKSSLLSLRNGAKDKGVAKVASYLAHLLACNTQEVETKEEKDGVMQSSTKSVTAPAVGGAALVAELAKEALAVTFRPAPTVAAEKQLTKAYVAALAKLAAAVPLAPISVLEDAEQRAAAREVLAAGAEAAAQCAGRVAEKPAIKDLTAAVESMCEAMGEVPEDEDAGTVVDEEEINRRVMEECMALAAGDDVPLPLKQKVVKPVAGLSVKEIKERKAAREASPELDDDATPEKPARSKTARAGRSRAALKENVVA